MSRIDYSKWDNIDTDSSDSDSPPAPPPPRPEPPLTTTTPSLPVDPVTAIKTCKMPCKGDTSALFFTPIDLPPEHPIFDPDNAAVSALSLRIGIPIVLHRLDPRPPLSILPRSASLDNQPVTYLMIDLDSGFAPPHWQQGVGTVIAARRDKKPLPTTHLEAVWMFASALLDRYGEGEAVDPEVHITRSAFEEFYAEYREGQMELPAEKDRWQTAGSPYDL